MVRSRRIHVSKTRKRWSLVVIVVLLAIVAAWLMLPPPSPVRAAKPLSPSLAAEFAALTGHAVPTGTTLLQESGEDPAKGTRNPRFYTLWVPTPAALLSSSLATMIKPDRSIEGTSIAVVQHHYTRFDPDKVTATGHGQWTGPKWECQAITLTLPDGIILRVFVFDPSD